MKYATKKKKVLVGALVACVAAIMATGSLAYLTFNDTAVNTFHVDEREATEVGEFSIALYENWETADGKLSGTGEAGGVDYGTVAAGDVVVKEPFVSNTSIDAHEAYVRLNVTVTSASHVATDYTVDNPVVESDADAITAAVMGMFGFKNAKTGEFEAYTVNDGDEWGSDWMLTGTPAYDSTNDVVTFALVLDAKVAQTADSPVAFSALKMPKGLAQGDAFKLFQVKLSADAISATDIVDEFGADEDVANAGYDVSEAAGAFAFMEAEPDNAEESVVI